MRRRWLAIAVILIVPSGCDNVKWGGISVHLQQPAVQGPRTAAPTRKSGPTPPVVHVPLPAGPILLTGTRDGNSATLTVVGAVTGDSLAPFPSDKAIPGYRAYFTRQLLAPGSELVLFSDGVRVGHLTVADTGVDSGYCVPRPTVTGVVELVPAAAGAKHFLALTGSAAGRRPYGPYEALRDNYDQRVASLTLASQAIRQVGATWPSSLLDSRANIQVFQLQGAPGPYVAATFLYQDRLSTAAPGANAYALFVMGAERDSTTYRSEFVWYRKADTDGKGAPRYVDHLDLNGDGRSEVLLDMFGSGTRWFALLGEHAGSWATTYEDPCGVRSGSTAGK
jgi:hypothetical protein